MAADLTTPIAPAESVPWPGDAGDALGSEMFTRFLASCLVDADFLDTEAHFVGDAGRVAPSLGDLADPTRGRILARFDSELGRMAAARTTYRRHVVDRASNCAPGVYRLSGPTGVGKTIAGFAAALEHAQRNHQQRVIIAVPYTTVTEQVADVLRDLVGDDSGVLEHHSGVADGNDSWWRRLAAQNWDAPVVVTTTVQLFESLFSNRPSAIRKLHNLANSVVLLDEAQCLPTSCLAPIVSALDWLVRCAGTTVVLQTATQPAFDLIDQWHGREFVDWGNVDLGDVFERVRWRHLEPLSHEELGAHLSGSARSVLCVVNTVADAHRVGLTVDGAISLTTRLCPDHRRAVLKRVRSGLEAGLTLRVVATQMVEAGVDLDFPAVWRAEGPLPSIAQAGGRCNRNARMDGLGDGVTFELEGGKLPPGDYSTATTYTSAARRHFGAAFHPEATGVLRWWYEALYGHGHGPGPVVFDRDQKPVQAARRKLDFPETDQRFWMIDPQVPVIVPWGERGDRDHVDDLVAKLRARVPVDRDGLRFLSKFTVALAVGTARRLAERGLIDPVESQPNGTGVLLGRWLGTYDDTFGLITDDDHTTGAHQW